MAKDHYVPQFYLRNFEINTPTNFIQQKNIYSYKRGLSPKAYAIKSLACELDFDTVHQGEKQESTEIYNKLLKLSEDVAPSIIEGILDSSAFSPSNADKEALSWFIALLAIRTPSALKYFETDILRFHETTSKTRIQRDCLTNKDEIYRILRSERPDISDDEVEGVIEFFLNDEMSWRLPQNDNNKAYLRETGNAYLNSLVNALMSKNWHLLVASNSSFFITSDNPVSFLLPRYPKGRNGYVFDSPILLPLSPKKALYIHSYLFHESVLHPEDKQLGYFLNEVLDRAEYCLFADRSSDELQQKFNETRFSVSNLNFQFNFIPYESMKGSTIAAYKHFANTRND